MSKHSPTALMPRYLQRFACIGPACPDTCCSGWTVSIDKRTWKRYREIRIQPLESLMKAHLQRHTPPAGGPAKEAQWATLAMKADGDCHFLDEQRLCRIQTALGEAALSDTCRHYPRSFQVVEGQLRSFATLSCPEAARLALGSADALDLQPATLAQFNNAGELPAHDRWAPPAAGADTPYLAGRVLQDLLLGMVTEPTLDPFDALALGLMLVRRLNALGTPAATGAVGTTTATAATTAAAPSAARNDDAGSATTTSAAAAGAIDAAALEQTFLDYTDPVRLQALLAQLQAIDPRTDFQLQVLATISRAVQQRRLTASARGVVEAGMAGLGLGHPEGQADSLPQRYARARSEAWPAWAATHPQVLRNYLVNSIERSLIGRHLGKPQALEDAYLDLVIRAALVRFWITAQLAGQHTTAPAPIDTGLTLAVRTIQALARSIEHDRKFMPSVLEEMQRVGIRGLATALILLR